MRFLHTADWQMGQSAAQLGHRAAAVRLARMSAARRVMALAAENAVDFIIAAGDIFEHNGVSRDLVHQIAQLWGSCGRPVYVVPGNHDPAGPGSVWENACWNQYPNIQMLDRAAPVAIAGGTLFPCPVAESYSSADPTSWIYSAAGSGIRIGIAHGSVEDDPNREHSHPISRQAAALGTLDYLALGHYHSQAQYADGEGAVRMAYCGTPEPTRFGERESGTALLVEIRSRGSAPQVSVLSTAELTWKQMRREIVTPGQLRELLTELEALAKPEKTLLDCTLEGTLFACEQDVLAELEGMGERFCFVRLNLDQLQPESDIQAWVRDMPSGYLRQAMEKLAARATPGSSSPAERWALRLATKLWKEATA